MGINLTFHQFFAQILVSRNIFHGSCCHYIVVIVYFGDKSRRVFAFKLKNFRLNMVSVLIKGSAGGAQQGVCLLDNYRFSASRRPDFENIVDITIAYFDAFKFLLG